MRWNDEVSAAEIALVLLLMVFGAVLLGIATVLERPGLALALLGAYVAVRFVQGWWHRRAK